MPTQRDTTATFEYASETVLLGPWIRKVRVRFIKGTLDDEVIAKLDKLQKHGWL